MTVTLLIVSVPSCRSWWQGLLWATLAVVVCVALPLLFLNGLLATRARSIVQVMDEQSARLLAERLEGARG